MAKIIVAFLSVLMVLIWFIGMIAAVYFIFRVVWLQYEIFERTGFRFRQGLKEMTAEEQKLLRGYALKAFLCFSGFLVIAFVLDFLIGLVN